MRTLAAVFASLSLSACAATGAMHQGLGPTPQHASHPDSAAQRPLAIPQRNAHVRVVFPATPGQPERFLEGYLYRLTPDTVIMARGLRADTVFLGEGRLLQSVVHSRNQGRVGMALGALAGMVAGAAIGAASWEPCTDTGLFACMFHPSSGELAGGGALVGGLLGGVTGFLVGSAIRSEEWATVPLLGTGARVGLTGGRVGVSIGF